MKSKLILLIFIFFLCHKALLARNTKDWELKSPDGNIMLKIQAGSQLFWSVQFNGQSIIIPSFISLQLEGGEIPGASAIIKSTKTEEVNATIPGINYIKSTIPNHYNQLTINCKDNYGLIFRVYNDAVAYRFFTEKKGEITVINEDANFNFAEDYTAFVPYMWDYRDGRIFNCSFESLYDVHPISQFRPDSLAFLPLMVDMGNNRKAVIMEADLEDYPGMFLNVNDTHKGFKGVYAPYPLEEKRIGINYIPVRRADYIARVSGTRKFPWRIVVLSQQDQDLLNNDIVQKLASPPRIGDYSWVKPGQVAWDWWNALNISHVDFRAGKNTATYKYYIDFAASNNIPYIILDGGWSRFGDLSKAQPEINLTEIVQHGRDKGIGVVLWATWYGILQQKDEIFPLYSEMGIKGFKIDFIDRDDQKAVKSTYDIAEKAAEHHLLVDFHGIFKPTGLQRTYPNVISYEGVKGMENVKWAHEDVPRYDVTIPFIRMLAGPMDYTPGAMRNANKENFRSINAMPMSQGTRCHQLAMYVVFVTPFQMLSDNPTIYLQEQECTDFITKVPVTFDETVPLAGKVGEYVALARRKGNTWYAGAMTNWDSREITLNCSFLDTGVYKAVIFRDGINSDRDATDYVRDIKNVSSTDKLTIRLSRGGGWAARMEKLR